MTPRVLRLNAPPEARIHGLAAMPADIQAGTRTWIQLFKTGAFYDWRYGDFTVTTQDLEAMLANFEARPVGVPGDFDHSFTQGEGSKAAGWTASLEIRADGTEMWGEVELTETAASAVAAGEYRFISPEFSLNHMNERGEAIGPCLLAWALTNRPFLEGMAEVSLAVAGDGRVLALHRGPGAADNDPPREGSNVDFLAKVRKALGLADDVGEDVVLTQITQDRAIALAAPPRDSVVLSKAEHDEMKQQADAGVAATEKLRVQTRDGELQKAMDEGRLAPVALDSFKALWDSNEDGARAALAALPVVEQFKRDAAGDAKDAPGAKDDPDAPIGRRIEDRAQALMGEDKTLTLAQAYEKADAEIRPRPALKEG